MGVFKVNLPPIDFHAELFNNLIKERGTNVLWEKAAMCACVRVDAAAGKTAFSCGNCYQGNVYVDPQTILGVTTNVTGQRNAIVYGELALGGIYLTVKGDYRVGQNDRVTLKDSSTRYAELKTNFATCKVAISSLLNAVTLNTDHTRSFPVDPAGVPMYAVANSVVFTYTGTTKNTLTGCVGLPALTAPAVVQALCVNLRYQPLLVYDIRDAAVAYSIADYSIIGTRVLRWLNPATLPTVPLTILYESYPVYIVDQISHEYRDQLTKLGVKIPVLTRLPIALICRKDVINAR